MSSKTKLPAGKKYSEMEIHLGHFSSFHLTNFTLNNIHRENAGTLGWYPSCLKPPRSPLEGDIPNRYPLYKVYMGLIIKGTIHPKGTTIFPMKHAPT